MTKRELVPVGSQFLNCKVEEFLSHRLPSTVFRRLSESQISVVENRGFDYSALVIRGRCIGVREK